LNPATVILHSFCEHSEAMYTSTFSSKIDIFYDNTLKFCVMMNYNLQDIV